MKTLAERAGTFSGYVLGGITFTVSYLRKSRMFHPRGKIFSAKVTSTLFPPHALIRFSSATWKTGQLPDVLGISLRFSKYPVRDIHPLKEDQDLLFATIQYPWLTLIAPLLTKFWSFFSNTYYAVCPFEVRGELVRFRLVPLFSPSISGSRTEILERTVAQGRAIFSLEMGPVHKTGWAQVGKISVTHELDLDQESLAFDPFQNGAGVTPRGFVHHLRIGAYALSQSARPRHSEFANHQLGPTDHLKAL